jgi:16S rRNA (guanine966-N2)-methyltransferase
MRIIAGELGGRTLVAPKTQATRPMTDKVRAALFDILGPVDGLTVLDAYAGSGALGFEALSRGAQQVVAIESARPALAAINQNRQSLGLEWGHILQASTVESWLARSPAQTFNVIMADPPYSQLKPDVIAKLGARLAAGGILVLSHSQQVPALTVEGLELMTTKLYGDSRLSFYKPL